MKVKAILFVFALFLGLTQYSQTTHTVTLPSSGNSVINVTCSVGDVILFQGSVTPMAIRIFRNPTPNYTVTPTGTSTSYTVTSTDTSYSSIVSLTPVTTCVGKITITGSTGITQDTQSKDISFPNPVTGPLFFTASNRERSLKLYDTQGKLVLQQLIEPSGTTADLSKLPAGNYLVVLDERSWKIIKE